MPLTERFYFYLSEELMDRIHEQGNASRYLRESVRQRIGKEKEARGYLSDLPRNERAALLSALEDTDWTFDKSIPGQTAYALQHGSPEEWGVSRDRWNELTERAREEEPFARALKTRAQSLRTIED